MQARGATIRRKREECGYGLRAFARRIGMSASWLSRIERNQANPSPDVLRRIAVALDTEEQVREAIAEIADSKEGSDEHQAPGG